MFISAESAISIVVCLVFAFTGSTTLLWWRMGRLEGKIEEMIRKLDNDPTFK